MLGHVTDRLSRATQFVATILLIAIVLINIANVVGRYVFARPVEWAEEAMLYALIGAVFLSFVRVTHVGAHIRMDMFVQSLPSRARRYAEAITEWVAIGLCATVVAVGVPIVAKLIEFDQRSDTSGLPVAIPQGVVPLGFGLAAIVLLARRLGARPPGLTDDTSKPDAAHAP